MCSVSDFLVILNYTQVYFLGEKGITGSRVQTHAEEVGNNFKAALQALETTWLLSLCKKKCFIKFFNVDQHSFESFSQK